MWPQLNIRIRRLFRAKTLAAALKQIVPSGIVSQIQSSTRASDLIERVAGELLLDRNALLTETGHRLKLGVLCKLEPPSDSLVLNSGVSADRLRNLRCIIQSSPISPTGSAVVVSDPAVINREELDRRGVPVFLALGSEIDKTWSRFKGETSTSSYPHTADRLKNALTRLVEDASSLGAREVFLGHPVDDSYEFMADDKRYIGKLHQAVFTKLLRDLCIETSLTWSVESEHLMSITAALTRNFCKPVICLSWEPVGRMDDLGSLPKCGPPALNSSLGLDKTQRVVFATRVFAEQESSPSILLIDDDERFCFILTRILESKGWKVSRCADGAAAILHLRESSLKPSLIVCDVHMPNCDGVSFVKKMKSKLGQVPILMLTSDDDSLLEAELALLGISAFVRKNEDPRVLLAWVNNLLGCRSAQATAVQEPPISDSICKQPAPADCGSN